MQAREVPHELPRMRAGEPESPCRPEPGLALDSLHARRSSRRSLHAMHWINVDEPNDARLHHTLISTLELDAEHAKISVITPQDFDGEHSFPSADSCN